MSEPDQKRLFEDDDRNLSNHDLSELHWFGMPEFIQEKQEPFQKIIVRFPSKDAVDEFALMIGQNLTVKTKSIWHPKLNRGENKGKSYVNES